MTIPTENQRQLAELRFKVTELQKEIEKRQCREDQIAKWCQCPKCQGLWLKKHGVFPTTKLVFKERK